MKFGVHLTAQDWASFRRRAEYADKRGYSHLWVAETPFFAYDPYIALAEAAHVTSNAKLGIGCTNVVLRHEVLAASALASIDALAPGRVVCGLGSGDRAVRLLGQKPTRIVDMRLAADRMRQLWRGNEVEYDSGTVSLSWGKVDLPLYMFAEGHRSLTLAGEVGDAAVVGSGITRDIIEWSSGRIRDGVTGSPVSRLPKIWHACLVSIGDSKESAFEAVRPRLANRVRHNYMAAPDLVPREHQDECERLLRSFNLKDWHQAKQAELVTDYMVRRFALAGTSEDIVEQIRELERRGVAGLVLNFPVEEFDKHLELFAKEIITNVEG